MKSITIYRALGLILVICGIAGYLTVADELRHMGEFIGVSSIMIAGMIFLMVDSKTRIAGNLAIQWIAFGLLAGIPFGGIVLDNMLLGVGSGICVGVATAFLLRRKKPAITSEKEIMQSRTHLREER